MRKKDFVPGYYVVKVSGRLTIAYVWNVPGAALNVRTGRTISIRTCGKLRRECNAFEIEKAKEFANKKGITLSRHSVCFN